MFRPLPPPVQFLEIGSNEKIFRDGQQYRAKRYM